MGTAFAHYGGTVAAQAGVQKHTGDAAKHLQVMTQSVNTYIHEEDK